MKIRTVTVLSLLFTHALAPAVRAADHPVVMTENWTFVPNYLEIDAGDTVTWYNADDFDSHDATSTTFLWGTGDIAPEDSATLQFNTPGTYPYRDSLYGPLGMTGTLVVKETTTPPLPATLTEPLRLPDGAFRFTITGLTPGKTNVVAVSTNLVDWTPISTNVPASDTFAFTNAATAGVGSQFYQSWQIP